MVGLTTACMGYTVVTTIYSLGPVGDTAVPLIISVGVVMWRKHG